MFHRVSKLGLNRIFEHRNGIHSLLNDITLHTSCHTGCWPDPCSVVAMFLSLSISHCPFCNLLRCPTLHFLIITSPFDVTPCSMKKFIEHVDSNFSHFVFYTPVYVFIRCFIRFLNSVLCFTILFSMPFLPPSYVLYCSNIRVYYIWIPFKFCRFAIFPKFNLVFSEVSLKHWSHSYFRKCYYGLLSREDGMCDALGVYGGMSMDGGR
jgi:hypothetical protein